MQKAAFEKRVSNYVLFKLSLMSFPFGCRAAVVGGLVVLAFNKVFPHVARKVGAEVSPCNAVTYALVSHLAAVVGVEEVGRVVGYPVFVLVGGVRHAPDYEASALRLGHVLLV